MYHDHKRPWWGPFAGSLLLLTGISAASCTTTTVPATTTTITTTGTTRQPETEKSGGFFSRMMDQLTERECLVGGFSCPYGFGPADEPCDCTDPSGIVRKGRTIK
jgi:hypothetical protein